MIKLVKITTSTNPKKKYDAHFIVDNKEKVVSFGASGYSDFTLHKDVKRKNLYLTRHKGMNEDWNNPLTAGALSRWILWNKPTLKDSIEDFKKRFKI